MSSQSFAEDFSDEETLLMILMFTADSNVKNIDYFIHVLISLYVGMH